MARRRQRPKREQIHADRVAIWPDDDRCPLCGRLMRRGRTINKHHLVPKFYGGTEQHYIHRVCHSKIHSVFAEKELSDYFHTFARLREHAGIVKFVKWIRKQDEEFMTSHRRTNS